MQAKFNLVILRLLFHMCWVALIKHDAQVMCVYNNIAVTFYVCL